MVLQRRTDREGGCRLGRRQRRRCLHRLQMALLQVFGGELGIRARTAMRFAGGTGRSRDREERTPRALARIATAENGHLDMAATVIVMAKDVPAAPRSDQEGAEKQPGGQVSHAARDHDESSLHDKNRRCQDARAPTGPGPAGIGVLRARPPEQTRACAAAVNPPPAPGSAPPSPAAR